MGRPPRISPSRFGKGFPLCRDFLGTVRRSRIAASGETVRISPEDSGRLRSGLEGVNAPDGDPLCEGNRERCQGRCMKYTNMRRVAILVEEIINGGTRGWWSSPTTNHDGGPLPAGTERQAAGRGRNQHIATGRRATELLRVPYVPVEPVTAAGGRYPQTANRRRGRQCPARVIREKSGPRGET
jgi:hypothetical protein